MLVPGARKRFFTKDSMHVLTGEGGYAFCGLFAEIEINRVGAATRDPALKGGRGCQHHGFPRLSAAPTNLTNCCC